MNFDRVVVSLDEWAPNGGAFAYALELSARLSLPLHIPETLDCALQSNPGDRRATAALIPQDTLKACQARCVLRGVPWATKESANERRGTSESEIVVFGYPTGRVDHGRVYPPWLHKPNTARMVCPPEPHRLDRVLIIQEASTSTRGFIEAAAHVALCAQAEAVIVTAGRNESITRYAQETARSVCASHPVHVDFDLVAGADTRSAIASVARWRRCAWAIVERQPANWNESLDNVGCVGACRPWNSLAFLILPPADKPAQRPQSAAYGVA